MGVVMSKSVNDKLGIDYTLPIISIPRNKTVSFMEWYLTDISNTKINEIPKVFDKGYITISEIPHVFVNNCKSEYIKYVARTEKTTFRDIENQLQAIYNNMTNNVVMQFEFIDDYPSIKIYAGNDNGLLTTLPLYRHKDNFENQTLGELGMDIDIKDGNIQIYDASCAISEAHKFQDLMTIIYLGLFTSAMWYMALYKNRYKYETSISKEEVRERLTNRPKPSHVNTTKVLTTSFYDLSKAPQSKVKTMIKKREGFEYSHQFNVSGHWRHYKDGKVVFIESYIKAKDKPPLQKNIILNPED